MVTTSSMKPVTRRVTLSGITDIMFDRYAGDNKTALKPEQKLYYDRDGESLILPAANVMSFLSATNTESAPKRFCDQRKYKLICSAIRGYTIIGPERIPITRNGKPIRFYGFDAEGYDAEAKVYIHHSVARLAKGIPNPKVRPTIELPWEMSFDLTMYPNDDVQESTIQGFFIDGGIAIGLGTYRGVYGKFEVSKWE